MSESVPQVAGKWCLLPDVMFFMARFISTIIHWPALKKTLDLYHWLVPFFKCCRSPLAITAFAVASFCPLSPFPHMTTSQGSLSVKHLQSLTGVLPPQKNNVYLVFWNSGSRPVRKSYWLKISRSGGRNEHEFRLKLIQISSNSYKVTLSGVSVYKCAKIKCMHSLLAELNKN